MQFIQFFFRFAVASFCLFLRKTPPRKTETAIQYTGLALSLSLSAMAALWIRAPLNVWCGVQCAVCALASLNGKINHKMFSLYFFFFFSILVLIQNAIYFAHKTARTHTHKRMPLHTAQQRREVGMENQATFAHTSTRENCPHRLHFSFRINNINCNRANRRLTL